MKRILVGALVLAALVGLAAPNAHAVGIYGIWWMPDDVDDDGYGIGIKDKKNFTSLVSMDVRVSYIFNDEADIFPIEATGLVKLGMLYGGLGVGYYIFTGDNNLNSAIGWYFLGGIEIAPGPISFFGEVKWQSLDPEIDGNGSVNLDALVIHAGVNLNRTKY